VHKVEGDERLQKLLEIQLKLNFQNNSVRYYRLFFFLRSFEAKLGPLSFLYLINSYMHIKERHFIILYTLYFFIVKKTKPGKKK